jgi:hypothetical protein
MASLHGSLFFRVLFTILFVLGPQETTAYRSAKVNLESLMPGEPQLFPEQVPDRESAVLSSPHGDIVPARRAAPVWLQRLSLFVLVLFCVYLGVLVMVLPWWTRIWDQNLFILSHPTLATILHNGAVRGIISGLGLLDIWIGISEAVHYRDYRG